MSAILDRDLLDTPLAQLTASELPLGIMLRHKTGVLDQAEATDATIASLADCVISAIQQGDGRELVAFINAMDATSTSGKRMSAPAVQVGTLPNYYDRTDKLIVVMGDNGTPVYDGDGRIMIYSVKEISRLAHLRATWDGATQH